MAEPVRRHPSATSVILRTRSHLSFIANLAVGILPLWKVSPGKSNVKGCTDRQANCPAGIGGFSVVSPRPSANAWVRAHFRLAESQRGGDTRVRQQIRRKQHRMAPARGLR